ncbi:hypothetical protein HY612_00940 [Candidatus Roizmanbacteria bacterium]|nr:hypothetical protein [Candidatus Roizmanbacteria bacterium]
MVNLKGVADEKVNYWRVSAIVLAVALVASGGYFLLYVKILTSQIESIQRLVISYPRPKVEKIVEDNTVYIGNLKDNLLLKYNGKFFEPSSENPNELVVVDIDENSVDWFEVIDGPKNPQGYNEPLSFKAFPDNQKAVIVMRWSRGEGEAETVSDYAYYRVFIYDLLAKTTREIAEMRNNEEPSRGYFIPIIDQISEDGGYVSFNMHACWNCDGGGRPERHLYSLELDKVKRLGRTLDFKWLDRGVYQYKEYKVIPCAEPQPGECFEDTASLPFISGSFFQ